MFIKSIDTFGDTTKCKRFINNLPILALNSAVFSNADYRSFYLFKIVAANLQVTQ